MSEYFAYLEVSEVNPYSGQLPYEMNTDLWKQYDAIKAENFDRQRAKDLGDIYPVFHKLFAKERA